MRPRPQAQSGSECPFFFLQPAAIRGSCRSPGAGPGLNSEPSLFPPFFLLGWEARVDRNGTASSLTASSQRVSRAPPLLLFSSFFHYYTTRQCSPLYRRGRLIYSWQSPALLSLPPSFPFFFFSPAPHAASTRRKVCRASVIAAFLARPTRQTANAIPADIG